MQCPKCLGDMSKVSIEDTTVDRCDTCGGLWFDLAELDKLAAIPKSERVLDTGDVALGKSMNSSRKVECPRCHSPLIPLVAPRQSHLKYESCTVCHGAFFDAGEFTDFKNLTLLERLKAFVEQLRK